MKAATSVKRARGFAVGWALRGVFELTPRIVRLRPSARRAAERSLRMADVPYLPTGLMEHTLDVWSAPGGGSGPRPVTIYVHGGAFCLLSKETHWEMALRFAERGHLVFNINYRLAPRHPFPAAFEDVCAAYEWVVRHAPELGGDLSRLTLAGESAGANLVTALAVASSYARPEESAKKVFDCPVRPSAVLAACGILQVSEPERFRKTVPEWQCERIEATSRAYLRGARPDPEGGLELADPLRVLETAAPTRPLPPFFTFVGTADPLLEDTRRLAAALERHKSPHLLRLYPGEPHAFHAFGWRPAARQCWADCHQFLEEHPPRAEGRRVAVE